MKYRELAELYEKLSSTTKRLEKTELLANFLKKVPADDVEQVVLLVQGKVFPAWDESEIGVASQMMVKAISIASGANATAISREWKKTGDLGNVAENLVKAKKQHTLSATELTVKKVFSNIRKIAEESGAGSVDRKLQLIAELLTSANGVEARYVARTILGDLRVGIGEGSLRDAIVWTNFMRVTSDMAKEQREEYNNYVAAVQQAYDMSNDFAVVAKAAKEKGMKGLKSVKVVLGKPIKVMLALKVDDVKEAFRAIGKPLQAEFKYDGFRLEIEKDEKGNTMLFTRRLENVTKQFPDVAEYVKKHVKGKSFILDAEAVGYDSKNKKYLPFQSISQRIKRKYDIDKMAKEYPVEVNVFDILVHDGGSVINEPFGKRRKLVEKIVDNVERKIRPTQTIISESEKEIEQFFMKSKEAGNEGLMLKALDAPYKPGARVGHMLKYKKVTENLDLAIIGSEWGEGKRSKWLSSYALACRGKDGKLLEIGRVSTGLKEKPEEGLSFGEMTQLLKPLVTEEHGKKVEVKPKVVIEVAYEEIQKSPSYSSGYALRFPRVVRLREDKGADDINTLEDVEKLYRKQKKG